MTIKTKRSYSWPRRRIRVAKIFKAPSLTRQSEVNDSDINVIYRKYVATGYKPERPVFFGEVPDIQSIADAFNITLKADEAFNELPSHIRDRFDNDPRKAAAFLADPRNAQEAIRLGLLPGQPAPASVPVEGHTASAVRNEPVKSGSKPQKGNPAPSNDNSNDDKGA